MRNLKSSVFIVSAISLGIVISTIAFAEPDNDQANQEDTFNIWMLNESESSFEIQQYGLEINSLITETPPLPCISGRSTVTTVLGSPRLSAIDAWILNVPASIDNIEPTTTVNMFFEKVEIPFNGIPGGISLEDAEGIAEILGEGVTVSEDPDNDNRIILTLPALTVKESHEVLCELFDVFSPPRLLKKESRMATTVAVDIDLVRYSNTPFLQTHKLPGNTDVQETVKELVFNKMEEEVNNPVPTDLIVNRAGILTLFTRKIVDAEILVKDQFDSPMPGIEVVATVVSNSKIKEAEIISPSSITTDIDGKAVFFFRFPVLGGSITFTAGELSKVFTVF